MKYPVQRALAFGASALGFLIAAAAMVLGWQAEDGAPANMIRTTVDLAGAMSLSVLASLIALHAGDSRGAICMALAIAFISLTDAWGLFQAQQLPELPHKDLVHLLPFVLGAGFFVRASQLFPREISASDVASVRVVRIRPLRALFVVLLRPLAVWVLLAVMAIAMVCFQDDTIVAVLRLLIVATGIVYFYIGYRVGDADDRRKVLWFLEAAVGSLVIGLVVIGILAVLGDGGSRGLRQVLGISVSVINAVVLVSCLYAAVFYAGAISPALVVRKTFVLGATIAVLLFVFAIIEALIADLLASLLGINDRLVAALFGASCGLAFGPLKQRLEALLRKVLPGSVRQSEQTAVAVDA